MLSYRSVCVCGAAVVCPLMYVQCECERREEGVSHSCGCCELQSPSVLRCCANVQRSRTAVVKPQVGLWPKQATLQRLGSGARKQLGRFYTISSTRFDYESIFIWLMLQLSVESCTNKNRSWVHGVKLWNVRSDMQSHCSLVYLFIFMFLYVQSSALCCYSPIRSRHKNYVVSFTKDHVFP